jgi:hypothetical protein
MKRCISTLLALLVLMNVMGYYALLVGLQYRNSQVLTRQLDLGHYQEAETRSFKVPVPGNSGSAEFTRVQGEFELNGQVFQLLKQRLYKDTFHIVFIKDEMGTLIKHALSDYARAFSDKAEADDNQLIILPVFIREYLTSTQNEPHRLCLFFRDHNLSPAKTFVDSFVATIIHPPQIV